MPVILKIEERDVLLPSSATVKSSFLRPSIPAGGVPDSYGFNHESVRRSGGAPGSSAPPSADTCRLRLGQFRPENTGSNNKVFCA